MEIIGVEEQKWNKVELVNKEAPVCLHTVNVWKDSVIVFGGQAKELSNDFYELFPKYSFSIQTDFLSQMAEGPFHYLLSWLDPRSICLLSYTNKIMNQRR
jgi:hypothetical protein